MKAKLSIDFVDFWPSLIKDDNYIFHLLSRVYDLTISSQPEVLFFSCYGKKHLQYNCLKIFYCAENKRTDFSGCDYALSFDFSTNPKHFRWPLYAHHIALHQVWEKLTTPNSYEACKQILETKKKFCAMLVSNPHAKNRIHFFNYLSSYKKVDSGGKVLNNIGFTVEDKLAFIKQYKFVFAYENARYKGYTTEKIIQPLIVDSIPIYWGNPLIGLDFNEKRFINANSLSEDKLKARIIEVDNNDELAIEILQQPIFNDNQLPTYANENNVLDFLYRAIESRFRIKLVSKNRIKANTHRLKLKAEFGKKKLKRLLRQ